MFQLVFNCKKRNIQGLVGLFSGYCNKKGFNNFLISDYEFTHSFGVGVRIGLSQSNYKSICPDEIRNELIHLVTKSFKTSHLITYVIKDTNLIKKL